MNMARDRLLKLVHRVQTRRLASSFDRWRRRTRIDSLHVAFVALVVEQRQYLLRKFLLRLWWRRVSHAFERWMRVCRFYHRWAKRIRVMQRRHWLRLAWWKWHRLVWMERLEEELIAYRWVLWTHRIDKLTERQARRDCRVILAATWVRWRHWHRRQRCSAWRRGLTLAMRRCFDTWKRYCATLRLQSIERRELVAVIVGEIINATLTLVEKPSVKSQSTRRDLLLMKWTQAASQQTLAASFSYWRSMLKVVASPTAKLDDLSAPMSSRKKLSYPQRFALEYKTRRRAKPTRPHRPAWR